MMMTFMPVFFGVVCYNFASGLNLYILTGSVLQILQSKLMPVGHVDVDEKKPARKKQHFYTAAQARKRQLTKELKEGSKRNPSARPASQDSGAHKSKKKRKR
jgi:membrane protein insertase Oxa1/YidC/SpoIIIJ